MIIVSDIYTVVVESVNTETVAHGQIRLTTIEESIPEEDMVYSKRIDFISDNFFYRGEATAGSPEASPLWRIRLIQIAPDGDIAETWAGGTADFNRQWSLRETYNYS